MPRFELKIKINLKIIVYLCNIMSLVPHWFGHVEFWIFVVVFFRQAHLKTAKQIFDILNSTCTNWWGTKDKIHSGVYNGWFYGML